LVDLGFGYSQILVMVLKIMIVHYSDPGDFYFGRAVLIIEEPEANLHPNLQSKLAEIFALLASKFKYYSRPTFIIETHSEYFIRKLQYLVAKKEIETNIIETKAINKDSFLSGYSKEKLKISLSPQDVIIYYFNDDKYVSDNESKVKAIEITENGGLSKNFGKGFLDESAYLNLALYKLGKENRN